MEDWLKEASGNSTYQQLLKYLTARQAVPEVRAGYQEDSYGQFQRPGWGPSNLPPQGRIEINSQLQRRPGEPVSPQAVQTLIHEMTHAASHSMEKQYYDQPMAWNVPTEKNQFNEAYQKLNRKIAGGQVTYPREVLIDKIAPGWRAAKEKTDPYRVSSAELPAFAVGNSAGPLSSRDTDYKAPAHIDPTIAQEMMILLELAQRQKK